jgi:hypothetical protein
MNVGKKIECSFCGTAMSQDQAKGRFVAGADAFICRGCVEMCIDVFARADTRWRNRQIAKLAQQWTKLLLKRLTGRKAAKTFGWLSRQSAVQESLAHNCLLGAGLLGFRPT